jgi:hypothetical protein
MQQAMLDSDGWGPATISNCYSAPLPEMGAQRVVVSRARNYPLLLFALRAGQD